MVTELNARTDTHTHTHTHPPQCPIAIWLRGEYAPPVARNSQVNTLKKAAVLQAARVLWLGLHVASKKWSYPDSNWGCEIQSLKS